MTYKLLLPFALVAALAGCSKQGAKVQADQAQPTTTPVLDGSGRPIGEATTPAPAIASANPQSNPAESSSPEPVAAATTPVQQPELQPAPAPVHSALIAIPAGTHVRVRLEQTIDTKRNHPGDRFEATLISPIQVNGDLLVPRGTTFEGHVTEAKHSGRFKGRAELGVELDSFRMNGAVYRVVTAPDTLVSGRHRKRNWILMGGGSGVGAGIGAIAAGGPGALIGAGAGAGAGAVGAFFTGRKDVKLPVETPLEFRLRTKVALKT
jgi:hypothetical protein